MRRALLILPLALVAGCAGATPVPVAATRDAALTSCPRPYSAAIPSDLPFVDRETINRGDGILGSRLVYQRTLARRIVLTVGTDPLDALEDLDMHERDAVVGTKQVSLSTTDLQPGLAVVEVPAELPAECGQLFVLTEGLTPTELHAVVSTLTLRPPSPVEGPG